MQILIRCPDVKSILTKQGKLRKHILDRIETVLRSTGATLSGGTFVIDRYPDIIAEINHEEKDEAI